MYMYMYNSSFLYGVYGLIPFSVHFISYWFSVGCLYYFDKQFINESEDNKNKYWDAVKVSLKNQFIYGLPLILLLSPYLQQAIDKSINDTLLLTMIKIFVISNISNILFYITHRILHINFFYKLIHKIHHKYIICVSPCALYAHPIEYLIANNLVFLLPYCLIGTTYYTGLSMIIFGTCLTTIAHVNYKGNFHKYHHIKFNYNYGFSPFLDRILKTEYNKKNT
jgi:sterol desaturase/sphingolipid hydroxylase (fatty acid hydroxylase superfamily)